MRLLISAAVIAATSLSGAAFAQQEPPRERVAEQCLRDLQDLNRNARQEGYWLTGWQPGVMPATGGVGRPGVVGPPSSVERPGATDPTGVIGRQATQPVARVMGPRHQMRTLFSATEVLAWRGDEEACRATLEALAAVVREQSELASQAGLERGDLIDWRAQHLLTAQPVEQTPHGLRGSSIVGADLRNTRDEDLGTVDNLVLNQETGQISHVLVSRGGFLGIGEDHYAVPWEALKVAPVIDALVLEVPEAAAENAPTVDPDAPAPEIAQVDQYWQQYMQD